MASTAFAQVYVQPPPPQPRYEVAAAARAPGLATALGWHGDRQGDSSHPYWEHDEWGHHPHEGVTSTSITSSSIATTDSRR
jgi:hypothetical protein